MPVNAPGRRREAPLALTRRSAAARGDQRQQDQQGHEAERDHGVLGDGARNQRHEPRQREGGLFVGGKAVREAMQGKEGDRRRDDDEIVIEAVWRREDVAMQSAPALSE